MLVLREDSGKCIPTAPSSGRTSASGGRGCDTWLLGEFWECKPRIVGRVTSAPGKGGLGGHSQEVESSAQARSFFAWRSASCDTSLTWKRIYSQRQRPELGPVGWRVEGPIVCSLIPAPGFTGQLASPPPRGERLGKLLRLSVLRIPFL